jgi:hypothetical protein
VILDDDKFTPVGDYYVSDECVTTARNFVDKKVCPKEYVDNLLDYVYFCRIKDFERSCIG